MRSFLLLLLPLAVGCGGDPIPAWAFDPIWLEPTAEGAHGFQTWGLYARPWAKKLDEKHHLCGAVVELEGLTIACEGCEAAFEVQATLVEHDCEEGWVQQPLFTALERVAIGPVSTDPDAPHAGATHEGWADYGTGWEVHGHAYAEALDLGDSGPDTWDGVAPFQLWPTAAFPLE